jgi:hypothetical protein
VKTIPSYVFAAVGVALLALGVIGMVWGEGGVAKLLYALVAVLGLVLIIFGGKRRTKEAGEPHVMRGPDV